MLDFGVVEVSNSPWMDPAMYVWKKSDDLMICLDYLELNKTTKDAYLLPLADEVQHRLANSAVFTTLDWCTRQIVEKQLFVWDQKWVCINFAICHSV